MFVCIPSNNNKYLQVAMTKVVLEVTCFKHIIGGQLLKERREE